MCPNEIEKGLVVGKLREKLVWGRSLFLRRVKGDLLRSYLAKKSSGFTGTFALRKPLSLIVVDDKINLLKVPQVH